MAGLNTEIKKVICKDGTSGEICSGTDCPSAIPACEGHGGIDYNPPLINRLKANLTNTQKWGVIIGVTALSYYILYKIGAFE